MEPQEAPVVELDDSEDLPIRIGVELAEDAMEPVDDEPHEVPAPGLPQRYSVAKCVVHEDFQDGLYAGSSSRMTVPPVIVEEPGRKFLRITASAGDKQSIPTRYPVRTRSTIMFTSHYMQMPLILAGNMRQTYQADLRVSPHCPQGCSVFELYQAQPGGEGGYGTPNGTGPAARFTVVKGRTKFETRYQNETKIDVYDLGVDAKDWHTYRLEAVWSHDPREGRFEVFVDGKLVCTVRGRDVNMGPASNRLPCVKVGLYGDNVTGTCDVDNIHLYPTGGYVPGPQPPTPIPPEPPVAGITRAANCGGVAYIATDGTVYAADKGFSGGRKEVFTNPVAGTTDGPLYQSWRYGSFSYTAPFPNGTYLVTLHFAENLHTEPGKRLFDVTMEGEPVLTRLDILAKVGPKTAYVVEIPVTVTDGALTVGFEKVIGNAMVGAIKVSPR